MVVGGLLDVDGVCGESAATPPRLFAPAARERRGGILVTGLSHMANGEPEAAVLVLRWSWPGRRAVLRDVPATKSDFEGGKVQKIPDY